MMTFTDGGAGASDCGFPRDSSCEGCRSDGPDGLPRPMPPATARSFVVWVTIARRTAVCPRTSGGGGGGAINATAECVMTCAAGSEKDDLGGREDGASGGWGAPIGCRSCTCGTGEGSIGCSSLSRVRRPVLMGSSTTAATAPLPLAESSISWSTCKTAARHVPACRT